MSLISLSQDPTTLAERLHDALAVTPSLIADVIRNACRRLASQRHAGETERVQQLIRIGAWTDAALALIDLELPQWRVRRLPMTRVNGIALCPASVNCRIGSISRSMATIPTSRSLC